MQELYILCLMTDLVSPKRARKSEDGLRRTLADFFIKKVRQQTVRKDSIQAVCRRMRGKLVGFLYEAPKNFELFVKLKKKL
jgi:hypothetical protein